MNSQMLRRLAQAWQIPKNKRFSGAHGLLAPGFLAGFASGVVAAPAELVMTQQQLKGGSVLQNARALSEVERGVLQMHINFFVPGKLRWQICCRQGLPMCSGDSFPHASVRLGVCFETAQTGNDGFGK